MTDSDQQLDPPSRASTIIQQLKAAHERRGKFGLLTLFVTVSLVAALLAILKATVGFDEILSFAFPLLFFLYGFAPLCCWVVVTLGLAFLRPKTRFLLTCGGVVVIAVTFLMVTFVNHAIDLITLAGIVLGTALFWSPQIVCVAVVRHLLFRGAPGNRSGRAE